VESFIVAGVPSRSLRSAGLQRLVRNEWEHQKHFPLTVATKLSQQFASHGLQFFKVNKTVTHVAVARPQYLDLETTPVSESIKRIVEFINTSAKCTRKKLVEALAPTPRPTVIEINPGAPAAAPAEAASPAPTAEQTAFVSDLHWLVHQGHVLEFADGRLETAKKPAPRPPKPEKKPAEAKADAPATDAASEPASTTEAAVTPAAESAVPVETPAAPVPAPAPIEPVAPAETTTPAEAANQNASEPPVS
jgi:hypothetical protein